MGEICQLKTGYKFKLITPEVNLEKLWQEPQVWVCATTSCAAEQLLTLVDLQAGTLRPATGLRVPMACGRSKLWSVLPQPGSESTSVA